MSLIQIYFVVLLCASHTIAVPKIEAKKPILNVAVIGSGISGLFSAKRSIDLGYNVTVFEQTEQIGGIWFYTNETGKDKYGVNIHTAMYEGLRANTPYQTMEFPGFSYPKNVTSYPSQPEVLNYLRSYAKHFDLKKHIKLSHLVIRALPIENGKWEIIVKNLPNNTFETEVFDAVFVCNGHFSKPFYPNIPGTNGFKGKMIHSHDFRTSEAYRDMAVLVIGGGNSGKDLVEHLSKTASRVTFSRHQEKNKTQIEFDHQYNYYSKKVTLKDDVVSFSSTGATFIDGSHQTFDAVIFATGYNYSYSFLSVDSGIHVGNKTVLPLYKQIFNINHPTMVFIGVPYNLIVPIYDLQIRFALKFISGSKNLPFKSEMWKDIQKVSKIIYEERTAKEYATSKLAEYCEILCQEARIKNVPYVLLAMKMDSDRTHIEDPSEFRKYKYIIIDDKTFRKEKYQK